MAVSERLGLSDASVEIAAAPTIRRFSPVRLVFQAARAGISAAEWLFGLVSLVLGLSMLAALPLFQFLSLGYLLESSARVPARGDCETA